jgi:phage gp36-like protein
MYCTPADVLNTHKLLNDGDFTDDFVTGFITDAQTIIDTVLEEQYVVPLTDPVPDIVKVICKYKAAALMLALHFSDINYKENTPLSVYYEKLADNKLQDVIEKDLLNNKPGIVRQQPQVKESRPRMASTTPRQSGMKKILREFDRNSQIYDPWRFRP